jgi:hypothetical protein
MASDGRGAADRLKDRRGDSRVWSNANKKSPVARREATGVIGSRLFLYVDVSIPGLVTKLFIPLQEAIFMGGVANRQEITAEVTRRVANKKGYSRNAVTFCFFLERETGFEPATFSLGS